MTVPYRVCISKIQFQFRNTNFRKCYCKHFNGNKNFYSSSPSLSGEGSKVIFMGNDNFALPSLQVLTDHYGASNVSVVLSNQSNLVGKFAARRGLQTYLWDQFKTKEFQLPVQPQLGVVASFGHLIPLRVIKRFPLGILNVHASILPKYRGAAPIAHAILNGDERTGVSIMQIAPHKFDVGSVLLKREVRLDPHVRRPEMTDILASVGAAALSTVLGDLEGYLKKAQNQAEEGATLAPKLVPDMGFVDWNSCSSLRVYNLFRGLYGFIKLKTHFFDKLVHIDEVGIVMKKSRGSTSSEDCDRKVPNSNSRNNKVFDENTDFKYFYSESGPILEVDECEGELVKMLKDSSLSEGSIVFDNDLLFVRCIGEGVDENDYFPFITIRKVKVKNKWMSAVDFQNGFLSKCSAEERYFTLKPRPVMMLSKGRR